ncbi:MAG: hypothetical protein GX995_06790 [Clostridiales bacterium]|nr:hypothetical protein [Clostridiales bacterium]
MSNPKIVVVQLKEVIYTVIFAALGILLIVLLVTMFLNKDKGADLSKEEALYTPGKYSAALILNDNALNLEVVVDKSHINSVEIVNIDEATTTMYPLIKPSLELITKQIYDGVAIEDVKLSENGQYTQTILLDSIKIALDKAKIKTPDK